ncbi:MAG: HipA domain-containing protein [Oscillospiraceae bacterium]|nr:HipA domain-containing protein [Oscillospiraceae bacterium]
MIDFDKGEEKLNKFFGSEVKTTVVYDNEIYMIKYPDPIREKKNLLSYMNNQYSEHIGSCIFGACGFHVQETLLGYFTDSKGQRKIVVGCKDFTQNGSTLHEFSKLCNQIQVDGKSGTTIESVYEVVKESQLITNKDEVIETFWDMFVVDALIGNPDRHFDNWGFLETNGNITFAPIYDCGSSLAATISDEKMKELLSIPSSFKNEEYNLTSCYQMNGKRIFYHEIFKTPPLDLTEAIRRTVPKIDMHIIHEIVQNTPLMSQIRKEYLLQALDLRYEQILAPTYKTL